jgi:hypothetical protein
VETRDPRPWEQPGQTRRDYEPHRADVLLVLGALSLLLGMASIAGGLTALAGLPLGLVIYLMARRDLGEMAAGRMDPAGARATDAARAFAVGAAFFGAVGPLLFGVVLALARAP